MDDYDVTRHMRETVKRGEPLVFVPVDEAGNQCSPSEAVYAVPDGPQLN
jgi:hypothetical protein